MLCQLENHPLAQAALQVGTHMKVFPTGDMNAVARERNEFAVKFLNYFGSLPDFDVKTSLEPDSKFITMDTINDLYSKGLVNEDVKNAAQSRDDKGLTLNPILLVLKQRYLKLSQTAKVSNAGGLAGPTYAGQLGAPNRLLRLVEQAGSKYGQMGRVLQEEDKLWIRKLAEKGDPYEKGRLLGIVNGTIPLEQPHSASTVGQMLTRHGKLKVKPSQAVINETIYRLTGVEVGFAPFEQKESKEPLVESKESDEPQVPQRTIETEPQPPSAPVVESSGSVGKKRQVMKVLGRKQFRSGAPKLT